MDLKSICFFLMLLISFSSFSKNDTSSFNPFFRDSVLKNKIDSARWQSLSGHVDPKRTAGNIFLIQVQKHPDKSKAFLYIFTGILLLLLILRLLFDDFSYSLLEGMISVKKFFIYYKSKKYDSFLAIIFIYILKIVILSLVTYIVLEHLLKSDFTHFNFIYFIDIWLLLGAFFTLKNIVEFIFNVVIGMQETFKAFFLQNLFAEFVLSILLLTFLLMYVYNGGISNNLMIFLISFSFGTFIVFNIVRSYQLMGNVKVPYKLHFFLYICAFKILPLLLLAKYILSNV